MGLLAAPVAVVVALALHCLLQQQPQQKLAERVETN